MDVLVEAHQYQHQHQDAAKDRAVPSLIEAAGDATRVLSSVFTYVARDKSTGKSARVNPLCQKEMSETEVTFFAQRAAAVAQRKQLLSKPESNGAAASANAEEMAEMAREKAAMVAMVDKGKAMVDMPGKRAVCPVCVCLCAFVILPVYVCVPLTPLA